MLKVMDNREMPALAVPQRQAAAELALPPHSYLTLLTSMKSLTRLEAKWQQLEGQCHVPPTVFQSFAWVRSWYEIYGQPDSDSELQLVAGYRDDELVFLWPLMLHRRAGLKILSWLSEPIGQYGDALIHRNEAADLWLSCATHYLRHQKSFDLMHLRHVRQTSNFAPHAQLYWHDGQLNERAPAMNLTAFTSEAEYDARYDGRQRKHRKRARKALEELGAVSFAELSEPDALDAAFAAATQEKLAWLRERGRFNTTMACPGHLALLKTLSRVTGNAMKLTLTQLSIADRPVSWEICFAYRGIQYCYMTAHVNEMTNLSPGRLHFDLAQRHWLARGQSSYDLMVPYDPYKDSWSSEQEPVNDYFLPLSPLGHVYGSVYLSLLRPWAKRVYKQLPAPALRILKKVLRQ